MGQTASKIQNAVDGVTQDIHATVVSVTNTISDFRRDAADTMNNVTNECVESLRTITQRADCTAFLLTNAILAMITAIALGLLLYLTHFSGFLRAIVWTMYASLCFHMMLTYIRHSRFEPSSTALEQQQQPQQKCIQYKNRDLETIISQSEIPSEIDLTKCKVTDEDMVIVVSQAIINQQCRKLQLASNQITANGISILADALHENQILEQLSLWNNQIGNIGVLYLSNILASNKSTLKKLDLSQNDIKDEGAKHLAQMLKTNEILTHLSLSNNIISDKGVQLLADTLKSHNKTLETLSLTENQLITDSSIASLVNMLKDNRSLKTLFIDKCDLSEKGKDKLRKIAKSKKDPVVYIKM